MKCCQLPHWFPSTYYFKNNNNMNPLSKGKEEEIRKRGMGSTPTFSSKYIKNYNSYSFTVILPMVFDSPTKNPAIKTPFYSFNTFHPHHTLSFTHTFPSFPSSTSVFIPYSHSHSHSPLPSPAPSRILSSRLAFSALEAAAAAASLCLPAPWWW